MLFNVQDKVYGGRGVGVGETPSVKTSIVPTVKKTVNGFNGTIILLLNYYEYRPNGLYAYLRWCFAPTACAYES